MGIRASEGIQLERKRKKRRKERRAALCPWEISGLPRSGPHVQRSLFFSRSSQFAVNLNL